MPGVAVVAQSRAVAGRHAGLLHAVGVLVAVAVDLHQVVPGVGPAVIGRELDLLAQGHGLAAVLALVELDLDGRVVAALGLAGRGEPGLVDRDARLLGDGRVLVCEGEGPGRVAVVVGGRLAHRDDGLLVTLNLSFREAVGVLVALGVGERQVVLGVGPVVLGVKDDAVLDDFLLATADTAIKRDLDLARADLVGVVAVVPDLVDRDLPHRDVTVGHGPGGAVVVVLHGVAGGVAGGLGHLADLVLIRVALGVLLGKATPGVLPVVLVGKQDGLAVLLEVAAVLAHVQLDAHRLVRGHNIVGLLVAVRVEPPLINRDASLHRLQRAVERTDVGLGAHVDGVADVGAGRRAVEVNHGVGGQDARQHAVRKRDGHVLG